MSVGNQGIDKAWHSFTADGRYRLTLKEDLKSPGREFGSDSLNSISAYCWCKLGYNFVKNHLAVIVVDTSRNDSHRFGLVIFSAAQDGKGVMNPIGFIKTVISLEVWSGRDQEI